MQCRVPRLLSSDTFVLEILLGLPSILWYRWTFQGERQLLWAAYSSLDSGLLTIAIKVSITQYKDLTQKSSQLKFVAVSSCKLLTMYFAVVAEIFCRLTESHTNTHTMTTVCLWELCPPRHNYMYKVLPWEGYDYTIFNALIMVLWLKFSICYKIIWNLSIGKFGYKIIIADTNYTHKCGSRSMQYVNACIFG